MADLIHEIKLLEQAASRRLETARREQEHLEQSAHQRSIEEIAKAKASAAAQREDLIRHKEAALEAAKTQFIEEAQSEALAIKEEASMNQQSAILFILHKLEREDAP